MIAKIEKLNAAIGSLLILLTLVFWQSPNISLSLAMGVAIGGANFFMLTKVVNAFVGGTCSKAIAVALALFKFVLLLFILWAAIKWTNVNVPAMLVGLSVILISIICTNLIFSSGSAKKRV